jgi:serum/glucocorticoid-regulated kinase 2
MTTIIQKTTVPDLKDVQASCINTKKLDLERSSKVLMIEYATNRSFTISYSIKGSTFETTTELLQRVIEKLHSLHQTRALSFNIEAVVSLQTKNKDLKTDYLLSLKDKSLDFLVECTILVPYLAKQVTSSTPSIESGVSLEDYEFLAQLGQGGFATVYLARNKQTGKFYAIKQIEKTNLKPRDQKNLLQERNTMIDVNNPFVARLYKAFQTKEYCYIVMDYMPGGDLLSSIENRAAITEETAKFFVAEIALGLEGLHSNNILYRDLKPENVLTDLDGHVVLSDFGLSKKQIKEDLNYSVCGTPHFIAPEVYKKTGYTHLADYFSLGVVAYEFVTGTLPFLSDDIQTLARKIVKDPVEFGSKYSDEFQDFVGRLLAKKPSDRLGAQKGIFEILSHPWLKSIDMEALAAKKLKAPKLSKVSGRKLNNLPKGFTPEKPVKTNILDELNTFSNSDDREHLALFSYYCSSPISDKKETKQRCFNETDEKLVTGESSSKKVTDYTNAAKPQFGKKLFS